MKASFQHVFEAIGTKWVLDITVPKGKSYRRILDLVKKRIDVFDKTYSRFRKDSLITKMSHHKGTYTLPHDASSLMNLYQKLYRITDGAFTPLIGQVLCDAGYDPEYSLKPRLLHHPPSWKESIVYDHPNLTIKKPAILDFGAAGKGHIIDILGELLQKQRIHSYCIDAGGDIVHKSIGDNVLRVGLEHPENTRQVIGIANIANQAICSSSGNRRKWGVFHHIINPRTLSSPDTILATWIVANTAIIADALATCLFFTPPERLAAYFTFEYLILYPDYSIKKSSAFPAEVFYKDTSFAL